MQHYQQLNTLVRRARYGNDASVDIDGAARVLRAANTLLSK